MSDRADETLILEAGRADRRYWRDLWRYQELFFILAWRDVAVRYKQTVIGLAWAFVRPFLTMVVLTPRRRRMVTESRDVTTGGSSSSSNVTPKTEVHREVTEEQN